MMYYKLVDGFGNNPCINYYGITQDPITKDFMMIMDYYQSGDLSHFITKVFYGVSWSKKLDQLYNIARSLEGIHGIGIVHHDLHSGNILIKKEEGSNIYNPKISDLGL